MKNLSLAYILTIGFITFSIFSYAQSNQGNIDYAVPESPASKILNKDGGAILRPSSVKALAVSLGNYYLNSGPVIPNNIGIEISPLALNPNTDLKKYNDNKFLYRTRISIATQYTPGNGYGVAYGLRFTLFDETDLRTNTAFQQKIGELVKYNTSTVNDTINEYEYYRTFIDNTYTSNEAVRLVSVLDSNVANKLNEIRKTKEVPLSNKIKLYKELFKKNSWNKRIWEIGTAFSQRSPDSLITNLGKPFRFAVWNNCGFPVGKKGHLLIGLRYFAFNDTLETKTSSKLYHTVNLGSRFYYGTNDDKFFGEVQYQYNQQLQLLTAGFGYETKLTEGGWATLMLNLHINPQNGDVMVLPGVSFGLGTRAK